MALPDAHKREQDIFLELTAIPAGPDRDAELLRLCGGDESLHRRMQRLLGNAETSDSLLDKDGHCIFPQRTELARRPIDEEGAKVGQYLLLQKIGEGGFGVVYMAEQVQTVHRKVAIKIIKPGMDSDEVIARFEAERQALALMSHPNIASILDGGQTPTGRPYFVMELVRGVSITEYCDKKKLPMEDRLSLFSDACMAVQHAHQKGIIHRDLKPSNIMVTLHDGRPVVKIIDFGIAKAIDQRLTEKRYFTRFGQMIGTPQYMSPEQAEMSGLGVDTLSDLYSLGVVLYELLVGTTPLQEDQLREAGYREVQRLICEKEYARPCNRLSTTGQQQLIDIAECRASTPESLANRIRGDLEWIVMKSLAKERERRYATPADLAKDISNFLHHLPVEACPPSVGYRVRKFVRRNRGLVTTASLIVGFFLLSSIFNFTMWQKAANQRDVAVRAQQELEASRKELEDAYLALKNSSQVIDRQNSDLELEFHRMKLQNAVAAIRLDKLDECKRALNDCPKSQRDWEWRRLMHQANDPVVHVPGKQVPFFLGDDEQIVVANDKEVHLYHASTRTRLKSLVTGSTPAMTALSRDKSTFAVADTNGDVHLIDIPSFSLKITLPTDHSGRIDGMSFLNGSDRLVTVDTAGEIQLRETKDGSLIAKKVVPIGLRCAEVDINERWIATACSHNTKLPGSIVRIWDAETLDLVVTLDLDGEPANGVGFSSDGSLLVAGGGSSVHVWQAQTWAPQSQRRRLPDIVRSVRFHPTNNHVLIGGHLELRRWAFRQDEIDTLCNNGGLEIWWIRCSDDGETIAFYDGNRIGFTPASITRDRNRRISLPLPFESWVISAAFDKQGRRVAVAGSDRSIAICDLATCSVSQMIHGHQNAIRELHWSDSGRLFSRDYDDVVRAYDAEFQLLWSKQLPDGEGRDYFHLMDSVTREDSLVVGQLAGGIKFFDAETGHETFIQETERRVFALDASPDGKWLAWATQGGVVSLMNIATREVTSYTEWSRTSLRELKFSPDSKSLAGVSSQNCWLKHLDEDQSEWSRNLTANFWGIEFTRSGKRLIVTSSTKSNYHDILDASSGVLLSSVPAYKCFDVEYCSETDVLLSYGTRGRSLLYAAAPGSGLASQNRHGESTGIDLRLPFNEAKKALKTLLDTNRQNDEKAMAQIQYAIEMDPTNLHYALIEAFAMCRMQSDREALETLKKREIASLDLKDFAKVSKSSSSGLIECFRCISLSRIGRSAEATLALERARQIAASIEDTSDPAWRMIEEATALLRDYPLKKIK